MRYLFYSLLFCCLGFSAVWAYRVNYETRDVVRNLKLLELELAKQDEKLIMLEGEWAYLNRPERLELLSERFFSYLRLMPMSARNFADVDIIRLSTSVKVQKPKGKLIVDKANNKVKSQ